jgi:hypothetical protein
MTWNDKKKLFGNLRERGRGVGGPIYTLITTISNEPRKNVVVKRKKP